MEGEALNQYMDAEVWKPLGEAVRYAVDLCEQLKQRDARQGFEKPTSTTLKAFAVCGRVNRARKAMRGLFGIPERPAPTTNGLSPNVTRSAPEDWPDRRTNATTADPLTAILAMMTPAERATIAQRIAEHQNGGGVPGEQLPPTNPVERTSQFHDGALDQPAPVRDVTNGEAPKGASPVSGESLGQGMVDDVPVSTVSCSNCGAELLPNEVTTVKVGDAEFAVCEECTAAAGALQQAA